MMHQDVVVQSSHTMLAFQMYRDVRNRKVADQMHRDVQNHNCQLALNLFWVTHHEALDCLAAFEFLCSVKGNFSE